MGMINCTFKGLREKKGRTFLITLSIAIGVFSVLMIRIISDNGVRLINAELDSLGMSGISLRRQNFELEEQFTNKDLEQIRTTEYVESATPMITANGFLKNSDDNNVLIFGIDENAKSVISVETTDGEKISRADIVGRTKVCQIDEDSAKNLFGDASPLGREIELFIGSSVSRYTVVGTVKASSNLLETAVGDLMPKTIYLPYTTLQSEIGADRIDQIAVCFSPQYENDWCIRQLTAMMDDKDIYSATLQVSDLNQQRESLNNIFSIITVVMQLIGGVSLLVSGLGIMTIMLISVGEKTKEIGIKKSIGAGGGDIAFEFLLEAGFISIIGSLLGLLVTLLVAVVAYFLFSIKLVISVSAIFAVIAAAVLCGVLFGVYPAMKAAALKPIDALRSE